MLKSLDYYEGVVKEDIEEYKDRNKLLAKIDSMEKCEYTPPTNLSDLDWWKTLKIMAPRDALKSATRALATILPKVEIQPLNAIEEELDRVEVMERVLEWQFYQMNRRGTRYPLWDIVNSALKYMWVCFQPVYLPYAMKGKDDPRSKYLKRNGDFVWKIHNPQNVRPRFDDNGLLSVSLEQTMKLSELEFAYPDNTELKKLIQKFKDGKNEDYGNKRVVYRDFTDWKNRVCWISSGENYEGDKIELERAAHGLPFLNWVIRHGDDPILRGIVDSGAYDVASLLASLQYGLVLGVVSHPATKSKTFSGETPEIDNTDPAGNVPLKPDEEIEPMHPRVLDPHLSQILNEQVSAIHASTVARALGTLEFSGNIPFATVNAILQSAIASLSMPRRLAETAIEDGFYLGLNWVKHDKGKMSGFRTHSKTMGERTFEKGAQVRIESEKLAPENVYIRVELRADTATDMMERTNRGISWHRDLNVPLKTVYEEVGIDNFDVQTAEFAQEQLDNLALQNVLYKMSAKAQEEMKALVTQQVQQEMAQAMQQQQGQFGGGQQQSNPAFENMQGQGFNPEQGGNSPYQGAPNQTRETITGETMTGEETAPV